MASTIKFDTLSTTDGSKVRDLSQLITDSNSVIYNDWAAKSGPTSLSSSYKNLWNKGAGSSKSMDHSSLNYGIKILKDGYYHVRLHQRASVSGDCYVALSLNGDRTTMENRTDGVWTHSHTAYANAFTDSYYIGKLFANEIVSGGGYGSTNLAYGSAGVYGALIITRIG